jgi:hypothetical protein
MGSLLCLPLCLPLCLYACLYACHYLPLPMLTAYLRLLIPESIRWIFNCRNVLIETDVRIEIDVREQRYQRSDESGDAQTVRGYVDFRVLLTEKYN